MMYDKGFFDAHAGYYWPCASLSYWCGYQAGLYAKFCALMLRD